MKNVLLALAICMSSSAFAQIVDVASVDKVAIPQNENSVVAGISPNGDYILLSSAQNVGLTKYNLTSGETTVITSAPGAGFDAKISNDGNTVLYRESSFTSNHLRKSQLQSKNLISGESKTVISSTRDLQGYSIDGEAAVVVNKGKASTKALGNNKVSVKAPVLSIKNGQLMITKNGKTSTFSPNGSQFSYIWPSVSPDATKILYYVCGVGAYVCDINGQNIKNIGKVRAPKWYNNSVIVGMNDIDNGEYVTSSSIVAATIDGTTQTLTDSSLIAMFPYVSDKGDKIAFSTPNGEAYIININLNK